jgi:hypothetical protein
MRWQLLCASLALCSPVGVGSVEAPRTEEGAILELVFTGSYHNDQQPSPISLQVTDADEPQSVRIKLEDLTIAVFVVSTLGPCRAEISMRADSWHKRTPASWPVQISSGSKLYVSRRVGRHFYEVDIAVLGYGSCANETEVT